METSSSNVPAVPATHKLVSRPHFLPPNVERTRGVSGGGPEVETDTIDLSKISHSRNSFRSPPTRALSPRKKPRLKISNRDRIENSIDRFDAFGDYEYIDTDVQQISAAIPGPGVLNNRRRAHLNQHRRVDFLPQNPVRKTDFYNDVLKREPFDFNIVVVRMLPLFQGDASNICRVNDLSGSARSDIRRKKIAVEQLGI